MNEIRMCIGKGEKAAAFVYLFFASEIHMMPSLKFHIIIFRRVNFHNKRRLPYTYNSCICVYGASKARKHIINVLQWCAICDDDDDDDDGDVG